MRVNRFGFRGIYGRRWARNFTLNHVLACISVAVVLTIAWGSDGWFTVHRSGPSFVILGWTNEFDRWGQASGLLAN